jgi:hypothetical protein
VKIRRDRRAEFALFVKLACKGFAIFCICGRHPERSSNPKERLDTAAQGQFSPLCVCRSPNASCPATR